MNDLETLQGRILETLATRGRWWTVGEVARAVDAPYIDAARQLARLYDDGLVHRQQFAPQMKPRYGPKGAPR